MSQREVAITGGPNNTKAMVTGQEELLVKISSATTTGLATETTLQQVETNTTGVQRTPSFLRQSGGTGMVAADTFSMSFASVGTGNATVDGTILKPGETINFDAGALNNTLGAVAYDTTTIGSELIIITLT